IYHILVAVTENRAPRAIHLSELNSVLAEGLGHIQLSFREDHRFDWTWPKNHEAFESLLWPIARSVADLLTSEERLRVRQCNSEDGRCFLDERKKTQPRRWCDMAGCGNRAKARRYYQRTRV